MNCPTKYIMLSGAAGVEADQQIITHKGLLQWNPFVLESDLTFQVKTLKNIRWIKQSVTRRL